MYGKFGVSQCDASEYSLAQSLPIKYIGLSFGDDGMVKIFVSPGRVKLTDFIVSFKSRVDADISVECYTRLSIDLVTCVGMVDCLICFSPMAYPVSTSTSHVVSPH